MGKLDSGREPDVFRDIQRSQDQIDYLQQESVFGPAIVDTLPTNGLFEGRRVYLRDSGKRTHYIYSDNTWCPTGGGYFRVGDFTNSGTVLSFTSIPQTYRQLKVIATCQSAAAGANTAFRMTFNGVTSSNYTYGYWNWGTLGGAATVGATSFYIGNGPGAGRTSDDQVGLITVKIPNYSATNINHGMSYVFEGWDGTTTMFGHGSGATNVGPAAVSSIEIRETGTNTLGPRAKAELWAC